MEAGINKGCSTRDIYTIWILLLWRDIFAKYLHTFDNLFGFIECFTIICTFLHTHHTHTFDQRGVLLSHSNR